MVQPRLDPPQVSNAVPVRVLTPAKANKHRGRQIKAGKGGKAKSCNHRLFSFGDDRSPVNDTRYSIDVAHASPGEITSGKRYNALAISIFCHAAVASAVLDVRRQ